IKQVNKTGEEIPDGGKGKGSRASVTVRSAPPKNPRQRRCRLQSSYCRGHRKQRTYMPMPPVGRPLHSKLYTAPVTEWLHQRGHGADVSDLRASSPPRALPQPPPHQRAPADDAIAARAVQGDGRRHFARARLHVAGGAGRDQGRRVHRLVLPHRRRRPRRRRPPP
uniref:Uncharacterized protein n=1 Tax=Aegilops tauschii subsp. strangulata TaxID=200361 RepID=A0A453PUS9_AEGTS